MPVVGIVVDGEVVESEAPGADGSVATLELEDLAFGVLASVGSGDGVSLDPRA